MACELLSSAIKAITQYVATLKILLWDCMVNNYTRDWKSSDS